MSKSSPAYLKKMEQLFKENGFKLRYEKGTFKSGHCLLLEQQVVVVNKFYTVETKISALSDIARELVWNEDQLSAESKKVLSDLRQTSLSL
ncbi:MAG: hypothetical protein C0424_01035 [Sphingobacteriaceae bacterium]|nr:hypothetical protein [Sphingobacteriaceae bacterium]